MGDYVAEDGPNSRPAGYRADWSLAELNALSIPNWEAHRNVARHTFVGSWDRRVWQSC